MNNLKIAGRQFKSRLMVGTGKFQSSVIMEQALNASEAEIVTVALRRVDINDDNDDILNHIDKNKYLLLPMQKKQCVLHDLPVQQDASHG